MCNSSISSSSSSSNIPFASNTLTKMGFFSFQTQNYLCSSTRCYLSVSRKYSKISSGDGGETNSKMTDERYLESYNDQKPDLFVYFTLSIDGRKSMILTKINVKPGDEIDDIRKEIKKENSNVLASVDAGQIELFESNNKEEPLNALETWNHNVTWGTKQSPLIVKVNPSMVTVNNSVATVGKCGMILYCILFESTTV